MENDNLNLEQFMESEDFTWEQKADRLFYELVGVMHFTDKWLDDDYEDKPLSSYVNRAAEAREVALKAIEAMERKFEANHEAAEISGKMNYGLLQVMAKLQNYLEEVFQEIAEPGMLLDDGSTIPVVPLDRLLHIVVEFGKQIHKFRIDEGV